MINTVKIGFLPTRRAVFSRTDALKFKELTREKICNLGAELGNVEVVDIEGINAEGLLYDNNDDVDRIINRFQEQQVDAVFIPHCNFGTEDTVSKVARVVGKPVLLWGPRDEAPLADGSRMRDTQCGLFATGKVLRRFNVPFSYIINSYLDDSVFERGFKNFVAVANVVKAVKRLRILQISTRPLGFWTMICNEGELLEEFGIETYPISLEDLKNTVLSIEADNDQKEVKETIALIKAKLDCGEIEDTVIKRIAALKVAIKKLATDHGCSAVAIQCWNGLQDSIGIMPCLVNALLTDEGIPVTCETDVHGAVTAVMAQAAAMGRVAPFFADLTVRHPQDEHGELLFHCGNFPLSLVAPGSTPQLRTHFLFPSQAPGTLESEIRGGDISLLRFDGDHGEYSLFMGKARGIKGPFTRGTYVWVQVNDWPLWEEKLVKGPYVHHIVGIHADVIPVLYEACNYIPGVKPDPVDPTESQIQSWLRGGNNY